MSMKQWNPSAHPKSDSLEVSFRSIKGLFLVKLNNDHEKSGKDNLGIRFDKELFESFIFNRILEPRDDTTNSSHKDSNLESVVVSWTRKAIHSYMEIIEHESREIDKRILLVLHKQTESHPTLPVMSERNLRLVTVGKIRKANSESLEWDRQSS
jgi:hypothetical protein